MKGEMNTYRVFISYSHEDKKMVDKLVEVLKGNGLTPMLDENFAWGYGFPEQIKNFIAHSHIFMPVITKASGKRGWVHQEIGYAMALNVPVLPITLDKVPGEMLQQLHALSWSDDVTILKKMLSRETVAYLIRHAQMVARPLFESAELHEDRTMMMVEYGTRVLDMGTHAHVRQMGALSSFHIPDKPINNAVWKMRYGRFEASKFRCNLLRQERQVLEKHARKSGCSLIIDPYVSYNKYGPKARIVRLDSLIEFLNSMPDNMVTVAICKGLPKGQNLTIVGDWFSAESISAELGKGYLQTIFTRHAPMVRKRIELFDEEVDQILQKQNIKAYSSRRAAITELRKISDDLNRNLKKRENKRIRKKRRS